MSPGDAVLMYRTGHFATLWQKMALRLGFVPEFLSLAGTDSSGLPQSWRRGVQADLIEQRLRNDSGHRIKACASCTTRPPPASRPTSPRCAAPSTPRSTPPS